MEETVHLTGPVVQSFIYFFQVWLFLTNFIAIAVVYISYLILGRYLGMLSSVCIKGATRRGFEKRNHAEAMFLRPQK